MQKCAAGHGESSEIKIAQIGHQLSEILSKNAHHWHFQIAAAPRRRRSLRLSDGMQI